MEFVQQIQLKSVTANKESIFFKVNVNGEDRIFIGQQNTDFNVPIEANLRTVKDNKKLSADLKLAESFQKSYIIDKYSIDKNNTKKDVVIPCAVSKEIVQLGNNLFSLTKETNDKVLYLMYKNRLFKRYVDDKTHMIYYSIDKSLIPEDIDGFEPEQILKGDGANYPGLISYFTKFKYSTEIDDDNNKIERVEAIPLEKLYVDPYTGEKLPYCYKNLIGKLEELEHDELFDENNKYEMPFNLIYEYGDEEQYENDESRIFADFIHLKNSLSPFFNVNVSEENRFISWRKYIDVKNDNIGIWTSYKLDTPKVFYKEKNPKANLLNVGNYNVDYSYKNIDDFIKDFYTNEVFCNKLNEQGMTIHIDCPTYELKDRYFYSYNTRTNSLNNSEKSYVFETSKQISDWIIENSNGLAGLYSRDEIYDGNKIHYILKNSIDNKTGNDILEINVIDANVNNSDKNDSELVFCEKLEHMIPGNINAFNFKFDNLKIRRNKTNKTANVIILDKTNSKNVTWSEIFNNDIIEKVGYRLTYTEIDEKTGKNITEEFGYGNKTENDFKKSSVAVNTKYWTNKKEFYFTLYNDKKVEEFLTNRLYKNYDSIKLPGSNSFATLNLKDVYSKKYIFSYWKELPIYGINLEEFSPQNYFYEIDYDDVSYKLRKNREKYLTINSGENGETVIHGELMPKTDLLKMVLYLIFEEYKNIKPDFEIGIISDSDMIAAFNYYYEQRHIFNNGDSIIFDSIRTACFEMSDVKSDYISCHDYYYDKFSGPTIKFFASPFDIREAIDYTNIQNDSALIQKLSTSFSIIDIFGLTINGNFVNNHNVIDSNIIAALNKTDSSELSIELAISLKDNYQNNCVIINSFINGELINSNTYKDNTTYNFFVNKMTSTSKLRFWVYGNNDKPFAFKYDNISMWNYPINLLQSQQLRRLAVENKNSDNYVNEVFEIIDNQFIVYKDEYIPNTNYWYGGKIFSINAYLDKIEYLLKNSTNINYSKLYKIQDFEFIDRISGLNKIIPNSTRKSNLYSIRLQNTGLVINEDDSDEIKNFKQSVNSALRSAINDICSKVEPINTKLFSILIDS